MTSGAMPPVETKLPTFQPWEKGKGRLAIRPGASGDSIFCFVSISVAFSDSARSVVEISDVRLVQNAPDNLLLAMFLEAGQAPLAADAAHLVTAEGG